MGFERRILHYSSDLGTLLGDLSDQAVEGCWFELNRLGGCGSGEVVLKSRFPERGVVETGEWIAFEPTAGQRWYLGRVEQRTATSPAKLILRLEGMGIELNEVFPGGFGRNVGDGIPPHRYARTDLFSHDPDYAEETLDSVNEPDDVVRLLMQQYVVPATHIQYDPGRVESGGVPGQFLSMKFRGEESIRTILKELALRAYHASWGVDAAGEFFFLQKRSTLLRTYREGRDLLRLEESCDGDLLVNRVLLTGDYVYFREESSGGSVRGFYRWRGNYIQPASRSQYGERRLKMWVPWIRTAEDSRQFVKEMFRVYSQPVNKYLIRVQAEGELPVPWEGRVRIESKEGMLLATGTPETIRIDFDRVPILSLTLGPEDPQTHWPEPPHDERWEVHDALMNPGGGTSDDLTFSSNELTEDYSSESEESSEASFSSSGSSSEETSESGESSGESNPTEETGETEGSESKADSSHESGESGESDDDSEGSEGESFVESGDETENSSEDSESESESEASSEGESESESDEPSESDEASGSDEDSEGESDEDSDEDDSDGDDSDGDDSEGDESGGDESGGDESGGDESEGDGSSGGDESGEESDEETGGSEGEESSDEGSSGGGDESSEGTIIVGCCDNPLPSVLYADFQNETGCSDWSGLSVELTNNGGGSWNGESEEGPDPIQVSLSCHPTLGWHLQIDGNPCHGSSSATSVVSCSPLTLEFADFSLGVHCCESNSGRVTITITE